MKKLLLTLALLVIYSGHSLADITVVTTASDNGTYGPTRDVTDPPDFVDVAVNPGDVVVLVTATNKPYDNAVISFASNAVTSDEDQFDTSGFSADDGFQTYLGYFNIAPSVAAGTTFTFEVNRDPGAGADDNITISSTIAVLRADSGEMVFLDSAGNEWRNLDAGTTYPFNDAMTWSANADHGQFAVVGGGSSRRGDLGPINGTLDIVNTNGGIGGTVRLNGYKVPAAASSTGYTVNWELVNQGDGEHGSTLSAAFAEILAPTPQYTVGGTVSGLNGELKLTNNGADEITITSDGSFTFPTALDDGSAYAVTISQTPVTQTCSLTNGSGTLSGADVTDVTVTCADVPTYAVGGTISGLNGTIVLQNNGGDDLSRSADGPFAFATELVEGATYNVTILTEPTTQSCSVSNGSGTVGTANVTDVTVTCVDAVKYAVNVELSGLAAGESVTLQNNGADSLVLTADGTTAFSNTLENGAAYAVTVSVQPASQECTVSGGSGTIAGADVTVPVTCVDVATYAVGGMVSGLVGDLTLLLNGGSDLVISADGAFTFADELKTGDSYTVSVAASPSGQTCSVTGGASGTIGDADITSVVVECVEDTGPPPSYDPDASDVPILSRWGLLVLVLTLGLVAFAQRRYF